MLATHPFAKRSLNVIYNGREGCAVCGRVRELHPDRPVATFADCTAVLVHRVLARHSPHERCSECPEVGKR